LCNCHWRLCNKYLNLRNMAFGKQSTREFHRNQTPPSLLTKTSLANGTSNIIDAH
jgi:hypothetical protein